MEMRIFVGFFSLSTFFCNEVLATSCIPSSFKEQCLNISREIGAKSTYNNGFCWVVNLTELADRDSAVSKCKQAFKDGRLAFVTNKNDLEALKIVFDLTPGVWSGLTRDTAQPEPGGWQYMSADQALAYAPDALWSVGSPAPGIGDAALLKNDGYEQRHAPMAYEFLCQFPEPPSCPNKACFDSAVKGNRVATSMGNVTIDVFSGVNIHRCSRLCAELATCQSYAHNKNTKQCELYWLPVEGLTMESAAGFDIFDRMGNNKNCKMLQDCFDVCAPLPPTAGSAVYHDQSYPDGTYLDQTEMTLTCNPDERHIQGTVANTSVLSTCHAPTWTTSGCEPVCPPYAVTSDMSSSYSQALSDTTVSSGESAAISCTTFGHLYVNGLKHPASSVNISCTAPSWNTTDAIECAVCGVLNITNGTFTYSTTPSDDKLAHETVATLQCESGYYAMNASNFTAFNATVSCQFGKWTELKTSCVPLPAAYDMYEIYWNTSTDILYLPKWQYDTKPASAQQGYQFSIIHKSIKECPEKVSLFRLRRLAPNNDHLYTADEALKDSLDGNADGWVYEFIAGTCATQYGQCGLTHELHQFYNSNNTAHIYRRDVTSVSGWSYENFICYVF